MPSDLGIDWGDVFARYGHLSDSALARLIGSHPSTPRRHRRAMAARIEAGLSPVADAAPHPMSAAAASGRIAPPLCEECHRAPPDREGWFRGRWICAECLRRGDAEEYALAVHYARVTSIASSAGWTQDDAIGALKITVAERERIRGVGEPLPSGPSHRARTRRRTVRRLHVAIPDAEQREAGR